MADPEKQLDLLVREAVVRAFGDAVSAGGAPPDAAVHQSAHDDYQADVALALGKRLGRPPRDVAAALAAALPAGGPVLAAAAVAGPGFVNLRLQDGHLAGELGRMLADAERLDVAAAASRRRIVIDYSSPNVAKEMHVGHLRSTVIGDALARLHAFLGHEVIRQNHVGDWGTPFGMLVEHLRDAAAAGGGGAGGGDVALPDLGALYQAARAKFDGDPAFAERARRRVVLLQQGDAETLALWRRLMSVSLDHIGRVYERLRISLRPEDVVPESFYNPVLPDVVAELERKGLARESEGALCVFPPGFAGRDGAPLPLIARKQDGGFGYATTDLAALRYRTGHLGASRILVVVGAPQAQHLAMVFAVGRMAGWLGADQEAAHVAFGSVLGADKKMLKTRAGESVKLLDLVDEGIGRAAKVVRTKAPELPAEEAAAIAEAVAVGAIKYADLANDRIKDYVFDWNKMLAFDGNTAPYLMYAHARIRSLFRRAEVDPASVRGAPIQLGAAGERKLGLELVRLEGVLRRAADGQHPHRLAGYLYDVATAFTGFYESCPVLKSDGATRASRLALSLLAGDVLARGLDLLGIPAPERM
jgi:arginyl-tRNA synthetase